MSGTKWAAAGNGLMGARDFSCCARATETDGPTDSRLPEGGIDRESLERLLYAVTDRYVACDGTVVNGGG